MRNDMAPDDDSEEVVETTVNLFHEVTPRAGRQVQREGGRVTEKEEEADPVLCRCARR